ncbi:MAG: hypothetical protein AAGD25_15035 [Cyanobacteria bacterium P01_F01_bin.150]
MIRPTSITNPIPTPDYALDILAPDGCDPRDYPESPPSVIVTAHNLASLGLHPDNALRFSGYPHLQTQLDIAAQYARIAEYAQSQVHQNLDRTGWLGVIEAIGPLQAPYLNPVLQFLGPLPMIE